jgi:quercetin dioxygenase-like cupin family protein
VRPDLKVVRLDPGSSAGRVPKATQVLLYVASGGGSLVAGGESHALERDTAALLLPEESWELRIDTVTELVWVSAPAPGGLAREQVTLRFADREEQRADENRTFRVLFETDVTQFVGVVQPCRAPDHSHPYDEVGYILEGRGWAHMRGESTALTAGSCFHLSPGEVHCIENSGPGVMRILGVFHPSGSPKQRSYDAANIGSSLASN